MERSILTMGRIRFDPQYASPDRLLGALPAERGDLYLAKAQFEEFVSRESSGERFDKVSKSLKPAIHLDGDKLKSGDPQVDAYAAYGLTRANWITSEYKKINPSATAYQRTTAEELAALKSEPKSGRTLEKPSRMPKMGSSTGFCESNNPVSGNLCISQPGGSLPIGRRSVEGI
jgi:hypothetical protein